MKKSLWGWMALIAAAASGAGLADKPARPAPEWMTQGVIYQMNLRSFVPDGKLWTAAARLPEVADLGASIVYLCPVFVADDDMDTNGWSPRQIASGFNNPRNPYRMKDFYHVDPEYGSDADLRDFIGGAHRLGLRVMLDMVYLHCGPKPVFLKTHPEFFVYDETGKIKNAAWRFPALNYRSPALRQYLMQNMEYWVRDFDVDGFRCDVADGIPLDFWEEARARLQAFRPDIGMLAEGERPENQLKAFDCNYGWGVSLRALVPVLEGKQPVSALRAAHEAEIANHPAGARFIRFTSNHDVASDEGKNRREKLLGPDAMAAGLAVCFTMDGIPFLYNGQEIAYARRQNLFGLDPIQWADGESSVGRARRALVKALGEMRKRESALTEGAVRWIENDQTNAVVSFMRSNGKGRDILTVVNFGKTPLRVKLAGCRPTGFDALVAERAKVEGEAVALEGYGFFIGVARPDDCLSAAFWKIWNQEEQVRIDADIEANRKANAAVEGLPANAEVRVEQLTHAFLFGAHIFNFDQLGTLERNRIYKNLYGTLFNEATIPFYWKKFEPVPGQCRFGESGCDTEAWWNACPNPKGQFSWRRPPSDKVVAFCREKGIWAHGHPLTWANTGWHYPAWVYAAFCPAEEKAALEKLTAAEWKAMKPQQIGALAPKFLAEISRLMKGRIDRLARHYQGRLDSWDVVNESADFMPGSNDISVPAVRNGSFKTLLPGGYTLQSFQWADAAFPKTVTLNINDYNNSETYVRQIEELLAKGARVSRVGSQMHLFNPKETLAIANGEDIHPFHLTLTPKGLREQADRLGRLGLPIVVSEITIAAPGDDAKGRAIQAEVARQFYRSWFSQKRMAGVVWWNVVDDCGAPGEPCTSGLFTRSMQPKPSFYALDRLINHDWKTKLTVRTDAAGTLRFRGFRGHYRLSWRQDGKRATREVEVR